MPTKEFKRGNWVSVLTLWGGGHIEQNKKCTMGAKACLISGELFDSEIEYRRLKSLLIGELKCQPRNLKRGNLNSF